MMVEGQAGRLVLSSLFSTRLLVPGACLLGKWSGVLDDDDDDDTRGQRKVETWM